MRAAYSVHDRLPGEPYSEAHYAHEAATYERSAEEILGLLGLEDLPIKGAILDVGSGRLQRLAEYVERHHAEARVICVDQAFASGNGNYRDRGDRTVPGYFSSLPFPDETFDRVVSNFGSPYHVYGIDRLRLSMREMLRVAKLGSDIRLHPLGFKIDGVHVSAEEDPAVLNIFEEVFRQIGDNRFQIERTASGTYRGIVQKK